MQVDTAVMEQAPPWLSSANVPSTCGEAKVVSVREPQTLESYRRDKTYLVVGAAAILVWVVETRNRVRRQCGSDQRVGIGIEQRAHNAGRGGGLRARASDERGEGDGEDDEESLHYGWSRCLASVDWSARRDA